MLLANAYILHSEWFLHWNLPYSIYLSTMLLNVSGSLIFRMVRYEPADHPFSSWLSMLYGLCEGSRVWRPVVWHPAKRPKMPASTMQTIIFRILFFIALRPSFWEQESPCKLQVPVRCIIRFFHVIESPKLQIDVLLANLEYPAEPATKRYCPPVITIVCLPVGSNDGRG